MALRLFTFGTDLTSTLLPLWNRYHLKPLTFRIRGNLTPDLRVNLRGTLRDDLILDLTLDLVLFDIQGQPGKLL